MNLVSTSIAINEVKPTLKVRYCIRNTIRYLWKYSEVKDIDFSFISRIDWGLTPTSRRSQLVDKRI